MFINTIKIMKNKIKQWLVSKYAYHPKYYIFRSIGW